MKTLKAHQFLLSSAKPTSSFILSKPSRNLKLRTPFASRFRACRMDHISTPNKMLPNGSYSLSLMASGNGSSGFRRRGWMPEAMEEALEKIGQLQGQRRQLVSGARRFAEGLIGESGQASSMPSLSSRFANQLNRKQGMVQGTHCFCRPFASSAASEPPRQKQSQGKKEISTVEDPFDSPTYHIPEKPVTFTEGASYSIVILAGLGIAGAAAYAVFKELIFEPKEYKVFSKALERIQNDSEVRVRIGSPIKGYGQESRNRAARQRIPHRVWTDEDGVEHIEVNFYFRGPHGGGKVYCEMFKDKADNQWKYMYLIVDILQPAPKQLILESFLPA